MGKISFNLQFFANEKAAATLWNLPNYVGELFIVGQNRTPFLNMIGGLSGGKQVNTWEFPLTVEESLEAPSQPAISETASLTAPTALTYVPIQTTNVCQIFQSKVSISYSRMSDNATLSGLSILGTNPIDDPVEHQKMLHLRQIAVNAEYTFLQGVYARSTKSDEANKSRGIITGITTNAVAAAGAPLAKDHIQELVLAMANSGAPFVTPVLFCNALQKQRLSELYTYVPLDRHVGGVNVETIHTDFAELSVVFDPFIPADTILIADLSVVSPVFLPVPGKGWLFYEPLAKTGAGEDGQFYGQMGLAYGVETYHGKVTGLAIV